MLFDSYGLAGQTPQQAFGARLDIIKTGFNAIRLPISADRCRALSTMVISGYSVGDLVQILLDGAAKRGLVVMLDMHR